MKDYDKPIEYFAVKLRQALFLYKMWKCVNENDFEEAMMNQFLYLDALDESLDLREKMDIKTYHKMYDMLFCAEYGKPAQRW